MFYLDAPFLTVAEGETWEVTDRRPSIMIGTLAHEFQHMIHFYQKPVLRGAGSEAWLNEMSSEVAEDLIADKMEGDGPRSVDYDDPTAGEPGNFRGRLPGFNLYNDIQVTRWDGLLANYDINYALGAYLARNYGGAALFSAIVQNEHSGTAAIEAALEALGHEISFGQALQKLGGSRTALGRHLGTGPVPLQCRRLGHLAHRRHGVPAGLDRPAPLRIRAAAGAGPAGLGGAVPALAEQLERAHAAAALHRLHHAGAQQRNHAAERQRGRRQPHHGGGQRVTVASTRHGRGWESTSLHGMSTVLERRDVDFPPPRAAPADPISAPPSGRAPAALPRASAWAVSMRSRSSSIGAMLPSP